MNRSILKQMRVLLAVTVSVSVMLFGMSNGWAQQKQKVSYKVSAENSKYTQQHVIDVGDVPGHQVRLYEIHRTFPKDAPMFEGVRLKEVWTRGYSDYTDLNGPSLVYNVYLLENGDKFYSRIDLVAQSVANADGSKKTTSTSAGSLTGGTGKLRGIRGTIKAVTISDIKAGRNETQADFEYWIEK